MTEKKRPQPPDHKERDKIFNELGKTMLVEAAAGTGKTTSMMRRMTELISRGECEIEHLVAVTYTRKAAAELRAKFQLALERAVRESTGEKKDRLSYALDNIERCYIGTIHSFCARILRERPLESGVPISFEELDEIEDQELKQSIWDQYVAELYFGNDKILEELHIRGIEIGALTASFTRMADYPDVHDWPTSDIPIPDLTQARAELLKLVGRMRNVCESLVGPAGNDKLIPKYRSIPRKVANIDIDNSAQLVSIIEEFVSDPGIVQKQWPGSDAKEKKAMALGEKDAWNKFREEIAIPVTDQWYECRYKPIMQVVSEAVRRYDERKTELGKLNFQDLLMKTAALLKDKPHIRKYFQKRYTHVLVDEFQDTDPIQAEMMMFLTADDPKETDWKKCKPRPGSLFVVGDPKQSIYRFRRADIVTYNIVKDIIINSGGEVVSLTASFRTMPDVVEWVNEVFKDIFPEEADKYSPQRKDLSIGRVGGSNGKLSGLKNIVVPSDIKKTELINDYDAQYIARFIRNAVDNGLTVPRTEDQIKTGVPETANYGDFMIITYRKAHLSTYANRLEELGIPYQVTGGSTLNEVNQLSYLHLCLSSVVEPDNPVALVAVLRSELFGISDQALYEFKKAGGRFDFLTTIREETIKKLSSETATAFSDVYGRLKKYHSLFENLPPVAAIEIIAADIGLLLQAAVQSGGNLFVGSMAKALELLRATQTQSWSKTEIVEFLGKLMDRDNRGDKYDGVTAMPFERSFVRIMNLHKAKGLEAPVVFLAAPSGYSDFGVDFHVDREKGAISGYMAMIGESTGYGRGPMLAKPVNWASFEEEALKFDAAEKDRLRYVAATRAGTLLVVSTREKTYKNNPWSFFDEYFPENPNLPDPGPQVTPRTGEIEITNDQIEASLKDISEKWDVSTKPSYALGAAKQISIDWSAFPYHTGEHGTEWGSAIHKLLEVAMKEPGADLQEIARAVFEEYGLDGQLVPEALNTVSTVKDSDIWKRANKADKILIEVPFQTMMDIEDSDVPMLVRGVIDLIFKESGKWIVVDYKTDNPEKRGVDKLYEHYRPQLKTYADAWTRSSGEDVGEIGILFAKTGQYHSENL
ncbi:MAG TPA: UvrD-helicase domain-containing protein [Alphaproteobacteria bacterium]|nr:UvrD-helicase domain-containing protein [Alphaproteobacteria bacterium]